MDADAVVSPLDIPQSQRKRLDFILLQKPTYERWSESRKKCNKNYKDSDFAEYLLDNLDHNPKLNRNDSPKPAEPKQAEKNMTYARGTQTIPVPKDLYKELEAISITLQFKSIVQTVRHLVDLFHEKYPTIKMMNGVPATKRPRLSAPPAADPLELSLSQGVIPGELLQPVTEDDSVSALIKNVLQTIDGEAKVSTGQILTGASTSGATAAVSSPRTQIKPEKQQTKVMQQNRERSLQNDLKNLAEQSLDGNLAADKNVVELLQSGAFMSKPPSVTPAQMKPPQKTTSYFTIEENCIYECTYCQKLLTSHAEIKSHVFKVHNVEPFFCRLCQFCCATEEDMIQHVHAYHETIYLCGFDNCNYSAAREGSIHGHYVASHCKGQVLTTIQVRKGNMWDMYVNRKETGFGVRKTRVVQTPMSHN